MSARKRYRPKGVSADSWKIAIQGSCLLSKSDQKVRADLLSDAVEKIGKGQAILSSKTPGVRVVEVV